MNDAKYCSVATPLFQEQPEAWRQHPHQLMTWTDTITGYKNEAKKLTRQVVENDKLNPGRYATATISHLDDLPPETITATWTIVTRHLRRSNVAALWVREITKANNIHYHLIIRLGSQKTTTDEKQKAKQMQQLKKQIKQAADAAKPHRLRVQIKPLARGTLGRYMAYATKARGCDPAGVHVMRPWRLHLGFGDCQVPL
jgi:hypothetical protein